MSHFAVLCVTSSADELDGLLAPYDENMDVAEYIDSDGEASTYNPKSKWDWWAIGGRWSDQFLLRNGAKCDQAQIADLDLDEMLTRSVARAGEKWDDIHRAIAETPAALLWAEMPQEDVDDRRTAFWGQPRMQSIRAIDGWNGSEKVEQYQLLGRDKFIQLHALQRLVGYALVTAEGWTAQGEMGWFGCGSDTALSALEHVERTWSFVRALPRAAWLTNVDCHI